MYFDGSLTSESYTEVLSGSLTDFLEDEASLRDLSRMWYQHDGAPALKSAQPCTFFAQTNNRLRRSTGVAPTITRHKSFGVQSVRT
ncbi:uncharacterized protein TNCV_2609651 [Trichonephila clavipes]|nr:uncharacterized protein TNCV_2609651 [Trichonephila clavipes]